MGLLVFDIGGTSVKYGFWDEEEKIKDKGSFKSPGDWKEMKRLLIEVKKQYEETHSLKGVAISAPGAVNQVDRQIEGFSALNYLNYFPIYSELEEAFGLPVSIENDANCAGLAEVWRGAAKHNDNVLFVVIGSGVGGAVIVNRKVHHGHHLHGGEFGFMLMNDTEVFSQVGTAVAMARRYAVRKGLAYDDIDGKAVFELAEQGDSIAKEEVDSFFKYLTIGLYNLSLAFDPEKIIIGGGVSNLNGLLERIELELDRLKESMTFFPFRPIIDTCAFKSDANLIGAVYNFKQKHDNN
ncbi:ROK family protein [Alkalibacterium sp.]|nr:MAG: ROK family protein [Alkalibacterium sp.]